MTTLAQTEPRFHDTSDFISKSVKDTEMSIVDQNKAWVQQYA